MTDSGRGGTGTISGATRTTSGRFGSALTFDGVNDLVTVADSAALDLTNRATLEAWVYASALGSSWRTILLKGQPVSPSTAIRQQRHQSAERPPVHHPRPVHNGTSAMTLNAWTTSP